MKNKLNLFVNFLILFGIYEKFMIAFHNEHDESFVSYFNRQMKSSPKEVILYAFFWNDEDIEWSIYNSLWRNMYIKFYE